MKQQIDNLIAKLLLEEGAVYLPEIGTLELLRHPAKLESKRTLQAPYRDLYLSKEESGTALTSHIVKIAGITEERAADIYAEWLEQSLRNNVLTIGGVCIIEDGIITTDNKFESIANPEGRHIVKIAPRKSSFAATIICLISISALCTAGYLLYTNKMLDVFIPKQEAIAVAPKVEEIVTPEVDTLVNETVAEVIATPTDSLAIIAQDSTGIATIVKADSTIIATVEPEIKPEVEPEVAPTPTKPITPKIPGIPSVEQGSSYAVWGVYNNLANAKKAKSWLRKKFPGIKANIYSYDDRFMVALYKTSTREACVQRVKRWKAKYKSFKNVWVYTRE